MNKKIIVVNYYTDENGDGTPTENDYIDIYLNEDDYIEDKFASRFSYKDMKKSTFVMLDHFFLELKKYKEDGFEIEFRCQKITITPVKEG